MSKKNIQKYDDEFKNKIVEEYYAGGGSISLSQLSEKYNVPKATISSWTRKYIDTEEGLNSLNHINLKLEDTNNNDEIKELRIQLNNLDNENSKIKNENIKLKEEIKALALSIRVISNSTEW